MNYLDYLMLNKKVAGTLSPPLPSNVCQYSTSSFVQWVTGIKMEDKYVRVWKHRVNGAWDLSQSVREAFSEQYIECLGEDKRFLCFHWAENLDGLHRYEYRCDYLECIADGLLLYDCSFDGGFDPYCPVDLFGKYCWLEKWGLIYRNDIAIADYTHSMYWTRTPWAYNACYSGGQHKDVLQLNEHYSHQNKQTGAVVATQQVANYAFDFGLWLSHKDNGSMKTKYRWTWGEGTISIPEPQLPIDEPEPEPEPELEKQTIRDMVDLRGGMWTDLSREIGVTMWTYVGNPHCQFLKKEYSECLDWLAYEICRDYPDRQCRRLAIMDCCPLEGDCPGHGDRQAHAGGMSADFGYYTLGKSNITQRTDHVASENVTHLWLNGIFQENVFDWERNHVFFLKIKQVFPKADIRIDKSISDAIVKHLNVLEKNIWYEIVTVDTNYLYLHHMHCHVSFGNEIDWEYVV